MFLFDIETLGIESTSIILSAAVIHFDFESDFTYNDLLYKSCFVKFDVADQRNNYDRSTTKSTIQWWAEQNESAKRKSFFPSAVDVNAKVGIGIIRDYLDSHDPKREQTIFIRGTLDQMCFDSLTRAVGVDDIAPYYMYRDVRTAVDLLKDTANRGHCKVQKEGFSEDLVVKHDPIHDCAYDIMMLRYGI